MKKNLLYKITTLVVLSLTLITSCTKSPDNIKVIPKEAHLVTVYNLPSLIQKGNLMNLANLETITKARNKKQNLKVEEIKLIDRIFEKPLSIGLNYEKDWFSFIIKESAHDGYFCFSASVINEGSITNFIEETLNTTDAVYKIEDNGNYKYTLTDKSTALAWDKKKLLIVSGNNRGEDENLKLKLDELFNLESGDQLIVNESFKKFYESKKDISLWINSNLFEDEREFKEFEERFDVDAADNYLSFFLDFKEGQINLDAQFDGNEKVQDLIVNNKILNDDFNDDLLEYIPADNLSLMSLSLDTEVLYEKIKGNRMVSMGSMSKVTPKEFLENMGGSIAFSVFDFKEGNKEAYGNNIKPRVALTFDIKDKTLLEELMSILPEGTHEEKDGYYEITAGRSLNENIYLAFNNSVCLISNDEELIINFNKEKALENNLSETSIASVIDDNSFYMNVNYDEDKLSKDMKREIERSQTHSEKELMNVLKQITESMDFKLSNHNTAGISLKITNKEENSLKVLIETLDENFERFENMSH